jgi:hypothetical protein
MKLSGRVPGDLYDNFTVCFVKEKLWRSEFSKFSPGAELQLRMLLLAICRVALFPIVKCPHGLP